MSATNHRRICETERHVSVRAARLGISLISCAVAESGRRWEKYERVSREAWKCVLSSFLWRMEWRDYNIRTNYIRKFIVFIVLSLCIRVRYISRKWDLNSLASTFLSNFSLNRWVACTVSSQTQIRTFRVFTRRDRDLAPRIVVRNDISKLLRGGEDHWRGRQEDG